MDKVNLEKLKNEYLEYEEQFEQRTGDFDEFVFDNDSGSNYSDYSHFQK